MNHRLDRDEEGASLLTSNQALPSGKRASKSALAHRPRISLRLGWPTLPKSMNGGQWGELIRVDIDPNGFADASVKTRFTAKLAYWNMPDQLKIGEYAILPAGLMRKTIADS